MSEITVSEINVYPIKSLGGASLGAAKIEPRGLRFDRRWMLVDETGKFLTQRELPKMATLKVQIEAENLRIKAENGDSLRVPLAADRNEQIRVKIFSSVCRANLYSDRINAWFGDALQTNCRLVLMPNETRRIVSPFYAVRKFEDIVSFADGYPFLLAGESSLADLNSKLAAPVPMNRFRPNLVVKNSDDFAEDDWRQIKIGETIFHVVKSCARCVITTVDQRRGEFDGKEPLKTLATFRATKRAGQNKILFGRYLIAENAGGTIRVGDAIEVLK